MGKSLFELDGKTVQLLRDRMGLSKPALARNACIDLDTLTAVERGTRDNGEPTRVHEQTWRRLARAMNVEPGEILARVSPGEPDFGAVPEAFQDHVCSFDAFIADRTLDFVGRAFLFDAIDEFMSRNQSGYFVVGGTPGIGKSAFIAQLIKTRGYVHHFNISLQAINTPRQFLGNVCSQLVGRYGLPYSRFPEGFHESGLFLNKVLHETSGRLAAGQHLLIAVDALDEVNHPDRQPGTNVLFLPPVLPRGIFFLVTTRLQHGVPLQAACVKGLDLQPDSEGNLLDVRTYIESRITEPGVRAWIRQKDTTCEELSAQLLKRSEGNFMYLHYVLGAIQDGAFSDAALNDLPVGLQGYYQAHWLRMRARSGSEFDNVARRVVCVLAAAEESISLAQLAALVGLGTGQVHSVLKDWREFLYEQTDPSGELLYRIYHTTFRDFLRTEVDGDLREHKKLISDALVSKYRRRKPK